MLVPFLGQGAGEGGARSALEGSWSERSLRNLDQVRL